MSIYTDVKLYYSYVSEYYFNSLEYGTCNLMCSLQLGCCLLVHRMATGGETRETIQLGKCSMCKNADSHCVVTSLCSTSRHAYCSSCVEVVEKMWPLQNGCLLCHAHSNELATQDNIHGCTATIEDHTHQSVDVTVSNASPGSRAMCPNHPSEIAFCFCVTCNRAACSLCTGDVCAAHNHIFFGEGPTLMARESDLHSSVQLMLQQAKLRVKQLEPSMHHVEDLTVQLRMQVSKAKIDVDAAYTFFCDLLRERRAQIIAELEALYNGKWQMLNTKLLDVRAHIDSILEFANIVETVILGNKENAVNESVFAPISGKLQAKLQSLMSYEPKSLDNSPAVADIEFVSNRHSMQAAVQNCLGYLRVGGNSDSGLTLSVKNGATVSSLAPQQVAEFDSSSTPVTNFTSSVPRFTTVHSTGDQSAASNSSVSAPSNCWSNSLGLYFGNNVDANNRVLPYVTLQGTLGVEKQHGELSIGAGEAWSVSPVSRVNGCNPYLNDTLLDGLSQTVPPVVSLPSIKRQKMGYHCKFGEFGSRPGQFVEPSGIATNATNDIIIADTNNHRLEVFDGSGIFKYEIVGGQVDCDLVYPNRLAVCRSTGDIVVTERSPTHQVQVFDRCGNFLRRFGGRVLQHPRGVAVDVHGRIVVVECRVMRVVIFDASGTVINRFSLMGELEFPNGVAVDDNEHIFISDNRAHCVKVCLESNAYFDDY